ncbi:hypothetical protein TREES_T100000629 [Tupaia chinensis]|uniref:Uncharacterized protein n=1 Tax=Tupaia chinensis TaxID=246437 RepID=L9KPJ7_TUPCH|nr:hypothetical protein TREES_T100000629 [Tupaia chinensis]
MQQAGQALPIYEDKVDKSPSGPRPACPLPLLCLTQTPAVASAKGDALQAPRLRTDLDKREPHTVRQDPVDTVPGTQRSHPTQRSCLIPTVAAQSQQETSPRPGEAEPQNPPVLATGPLPTLTAADQAPGSAPAGWRPARKPSPGDLGLTHSSFAN